MSQEFWTWIAIGVPFVLCVGTALVLALYAGRTKKPELKYGKSARIFKGRGTVRTT